MSIFIFIFLLFRIPSIFLAFTFTDLEDFMPLLSLVIGIICTFFICRHRQEKPSLALTALMSLLSLWPILPNIGLYFLARQLQSKYGTWPQVMVDDPKNWYAHVTPLYDGIFHLIAYLEAFSGAWMILFFVLFFGTASRFRSVNRRLFLGLMIAMLIIALLDPGNLFAWWLD